MKQNTAAPLSSLSPEENLILETFSLLPGQALSRNVWMSFILSGIDQVSGLAILRELVRKGWLQEEDDSAFQLPDAPARFIRDQRPLAWERHAENITNFFSKSHRKIQNTL